MMLEKVTLAPVAELDGTLRYLELRQGGQVIKISLETSSTGHKTGYKWSEIKKAVDELSDYRKRMVQELVGQDLQWLKDLGKKDKPEKAQ